MLCSLHVLGALNQIDSVTSVDTLAREGSSFAARGV
jgi:hypothetical protein